MVRRIVPSLVAGLLAFGLIHGIFTYTHLFLGLERGILNGLFYLREPGVGELNPYVSDRVHLAGFNEDSIAVIGKWPWRRYVHAEFLDKIQRYSPETVFFDIIFAKPETIPRYITEKLALDPEAMRQVEAAFEGMDREFTQALSRYNNVYLDLQLVEEPRTSLPDFYKRRIALNEEAVRDYSLPAEDVRSLVVFESLEPILDDYVSISHPSVINVLPDDDGIIRLFPLFYTYKMSDGSYRNVFTIALNLLLKYFHAGREQLALLPDRVVIRGARVPVLHPDTRQTTLTMDSFERVSARLIGTQAPDTYAYNPNLYRFMVNRMLREAEHSQRIPYFPLHVADTGGGRLEVVDGWEVLDAARRADAEAIYLVPYQVKDVHIETPVTGFYNINYAGRDERFYRNPETGAIESYFPIPTEGYKEVYLMDDLPDIPELDDAGIPRPGGDHRELYRWFLRYCRDRADGVLKEARQELGGLVDETRYLRGFLERFPERGKYVHYAAFFEKHRATPENIGALLDRYPAFAETVGQAPAHHLDLAGITADLTDQYRHGFDRYYNRFIFTGGTATGLGDVQQTQYAGMYGVNVIINAFNTIATDNALKMSVDIPRFDPTVLAAVSLVCCLLYGLAGVRVGFAMFLFSLVGIFGVSAGAFIGADLFVSTSPMIAADTLIFMGLMVYKLLTEERDKKYLKETFSAYLAPELIQEMHRNRSMPTLGGEARIITAFFTDIQGFSTFSEKLSAHQLVDLLNEYLTAMTDILIAEKGTLDKYEGDAIIAFFGAPIELVDQEVRACRVAVAMQKKLAELREKWKNEKVGPGEADPNVMNVPADQWTPGDRWPGVVHRMRMRIGINTGEIVVGNMGSTMRMNYTMMGDPVNLSARLEAAAKQYGVYNLVSEYTLDVEYMDEEGFPRKVMDMVGTRFLDHITVVGKSEPVRVYELLGMKEDLTESDRQLIAHFHEGMRHYRRMEWDPAIACFSRSRNLERFPHEKTNPSEVFIFRCHNFKKKPPVAAGETWDGVFRLSRK